MGHTTVHPQDRTVCRGVHGWRWGDWWWCRRWRVGAEAPVAAVVASGGRMRGRSGWKGRRGGINDFRCRLMSLVTIRQGLRRVTNRPSLTLLEAKIRSARLRRGCSMLRMKKAQEKMESRAGPH